MRVAIVHDALVQVGGAERVVEALQRLYPDAPIYTSAYLPDVMPDSFREMDIRTSFMQRLPGLRKHFRRYLLLYPLAFERFEIVDADVVLSSSAAWAHAVRTRPDQVHVCYCHTPPRWLWNRETYLARQSVSAVTRLALTPVLGALRARDRRVAVRPDVYLANSRHTAARIRQCYGRESIVVYPPVETGRFRQEAPSVRGDYFLIVSRLLHYKRIDLAVAAFTELGLPFKIAGTGPALNSLRGMAGPSIEFLGRVSDPELPALMAGCRALVFPGEEDFGITPVEAMAAGRPVIAFAGGGALETVADGTTGVFIREQTVASLIEAVRRLETLDLSPDRIRSHARRFDTQIFCERISGIVRDVVSGANLASVDP